MWWSRQYFFTEFWCACGPESLYTFLYFTLKYFEVIRCECDWRDCIGEETHEALLDPEDPAQDELGEEGDKRERERSETHKSNQQHR